MVLFGVVVSVVGIVTTVFDIQYCFRGVRFVVVGFVVVLVVVIGVIL